MNKALVLLNGVTLSCRDVSDQWRGAVVRHQYAGHKGADLEYLGCGPNEYRLRVIFVGDKGLEELQALNESFRTGAIVTLQHPTDGTKAGMVESLTRSHDNHANSIEVEFSFVEDGVDKQPTFRPSAAAVAIGAAQQIADQAAASITAAFGNAAVPAPDLTDSTWLEKLGDLGGAMNALVSALRTDLRRLDGLIVTFSYPVTAALNALAFGAELPGQLALRVATVMDLMQGKVAGSATPAASAHKFLRDLDVLASSFRGSPSEGGVRLLAASQAGQTTANLMATDEDRLRAMKAYESEQAFDLNGRWIGKGVAPASIPASMTEIANLVGAARRIIQAARPWANDPAVLDSVAVALQDQFRDRMVSFEQVREIVVTTPTPLHMICHAAGLPYNAAERVALLNPQIKNPTFAQGRIRIYAP